MSVVFRIYSLLDVLFFILVEFTVLVGSCLLVLLVLRDQIVHVRLGFGELHLVHTLT